ncbi:HAD family phosphatase [bacterium]|nr:HAD family phosphatase [bacterium]
MVFALSAAQLCASAAALLFDLDGTLVDSMPIHNTVWEETLRENGCLITSEILQEYAGIPSERTIELLNDRFGWKLDPKRITETKEERAFELLSSLRPIPSVLQYVESYYQKVPLAVVSGGSRELVRRTLESTQLLRYFGAVISFNDAPRAKPHPDPFLMAAKKLRVSPLDCVVFEDGQAGIVAAKAAGMRVIQVFPGGSLAPHLER